MPLFSRKKGHNIRGIGWYVSTNVGNHKVSARCCVEGRFVNRPYRWLEVQDAKCKVQNAKCQTSRLQVSTYAYVAMSDRVMRVMSEDVSSPNRIS